MAHEINQPLQSIRLSLANLDRTLGKDNSDSTTALEKLMRMFVLDRRATAPAQALQA